MSQILDATPRALREAFYVLSTTQDVPDARLLDDIIRQCPEFGQELTDFAIAVALDALCGDRVIEAAEAAIDPTAVSPAVSRAMSHFQNRLFAVATDGGHMKSARMRIVDVPNPFMRLPREEYRAFATRLHANTVFVGKLRDRQIDPTTMTPGFQARVSEELAAPIEAVVAHFSASQAAPTEQFFKAEGKPATGTQQSFEEAVRCSGLSAAQQKFLLEL